MPEEEDSWQFVQKKREGRKHRSEKCNDFGEKNIDASGMCRCFRLMGQEVNTQLER